jgi:AcrR family transcriptional regulator
MQATDIPYERIAVQQTDLTALARIRNAALSGFARDGVAATSIRSVARAAGVSPGLVQHHFPTKEALRDSVSDYVVAVATEAFTAVPESASPDAIQQELGDRLTAFVRDNPTALRYVARCAADGDPAALEIFDAFIGITRGLWQNLADRGVLRPDVDLGWAALHVVVLNLGTVLLERAVDRHIPAPLRDPEQLERWNRASNDLFRRGVYAAPARP